MSLSGVQIEDPLDARVLGETNGGRGDRVVGLELDHRPEHDPERLHGRLGDRELGEELRRHPGRRLVAREQVVAERFDDPVRGAADMRGAFLAEEEQQLLDEPGDARQDDAVPSEDRRPRREVGPEQLVGRVDEMDVHGRSGQAAGATSSRSTPAASELVEGSFAVAGLDVDGGDGVGDHRRPVAQADRVERRRLHAVIGRQADDHN